MTAVTSAPSSTPFSLLEVSFSSIFFQPSAAGLAQRRAHSLHSIQEQRKATHQREHTENVHPFFLPFTAAHAAPPSALCTGPARSAGLPQAAARPYTLILVFECKIGSILL